MITLTAKIDLLNAPANQPTVYSESPEYNNVSSNVQKVQGRNDIKGGNPFLLGVSKLGDGSTFSDKVDYFISNSTEPISISIDFKYTGTHNLTIAFDKINRRYPTKIQIIDTVYTNDDPIFTVNGIENVRYALIRILDWNEPNYPVVITGIYSGLSIDIGNHNLISCESSIFDRSDLKLPSFGIISNAGNIEFRDTDGEVGDYAEMGILEKGLPCSIMLNDTMSETTKKIGAYETGEWTYDNNSRVVNVSLKDDLEEWQDINVAEISYDPQKPEAKKFSWLYWHLWTITNPNYPMKRLDELGLETQNRLENYWIQYPMLKSGNLWEQWTKLCEVCQLHIYKNNNGIVECKYLGGN